MSGALIYFVPDSTDAKLFDRVRAFQEAGYAVMSVGFSRDRYDTGQLIDWPHLDLGTVRDGQYLFRTKAFGRNWASTGQMRRHLTPSAGRPVVVARNLDMALMARSVLPVLPRVQFVYECLDIRHVMIRPSLSGRLARAMERRVLARADSLWSSSPGFVDHYFQPRQRYSGPWSLVENKMSAPAPRRASAPCPPPPDGPLRIGWFGTLRCTRSLEMICALAGELGERVFFDLRGYPARIGEEAFAAAIAPYPNIVLGGGYAPKDLPEMMSRIHLSWSFDYSDTWGNSQWLRPNRVYEAGFYHRPVLADRSQETGRLVAERDLGWAMDGSDLVGQLKQLLLSLTVEQWVAKKAEIAARDQAEFAGSNDIDRALRQLETEI